MFVRRHKSGVSRIQRANYGTNQFGQNKGMVGWWDLCKKVRERDRDRCIWCPNPAKEVHHIKPLSRGGTNSMANLACICKTCHDKRHSHMERTEKRQYRF